MRTTFAQLQHCQPGWQVETSDGEWSTIRNVLEYKGIGPKKGQRAVSFIFTDGAHSPLYPAGTEVEVRRP